MYEMTRPLSVAIPREVPYPFLVHHIQHYVQFCEQLLPRPTVVEEDVYTFTWGMKRWIRD
ncbi:hypothetical protein BDZ91DRAFT_723533 [Kalaharituber pfeilii]|nr:hypothetical protein BDZ91DRAFT_723533 [Kalaharituber pfeilii]